MPSATAEPETTVTEPASSDGLVSESPASDTVDSDTPVSGNHAAATVEADPVSIAAQSADHTGNGNGAGPDPISTSGNGPPAPEPGAAISRDAVTLPANGEPPPSVVAGETESTEIPAFLRNLH